MPTFQATLLGNVFIAGAVISATLRIVARDLEEAESVAAFAAAQLGSRLRVDSVYELSDRVRTDPK